MDGTTFGKLAAFVDSQTHFTVCICSARWAACAVCPPAVRHAYGTARGAVIVRMRRFATMLCRCTGPAKHGLCLVQWVQILDILQEAGLGDHFALRMCEELLLLPSKSHNGVMEVGSQDKKACDPGSSTSVMPFLRFAEWQTPRVLCCGWVPCTRLNC